MKSFQSAIRDAMAGARLSPGNWVSIQAKTHPRDEHPSIAVRFDPAFVDAVPATKPVRRNYKAELEVAEGNLALMKTLIRNLLESYSSGDEQFHAACVADAHTLLAEVA